MSKFIYFAFGSNMLTERLQARCHSAIPIGIGHAEGWALSFSKQSVDSSGKATLEKADGSRQWGVLFEINVSEQSDLDRFEGKGYEPTNNFEVVAARGPVSTRTYLATNIQSGLKPYDWYLALILAGARQHNLPDQTIQELLSFGYDEDSNSQRESYAQARNVLSRANAGSVEEILRRRD